MSDKIVQEFKLSIEKSSPTNRPEGPWPLRIRYSNRYPFTQHQINKFITPRLADIAACSGLEVREAKIHPVGRTHRLIVTVGVNPDARVETVNGNNIVPLYIDHDYPDSMGDGERDILHGRLECIIERHSPELANSDSFIQDIAAEFESYHRELLSEYEQRSARDEADLERKLELARRAKDRWRAKTDQAVKVTKEARWREPAEKRLEIMRTQARERQARRRARKKELAL